MARFTNRLLLVILILIPIFLLLTIFQVMERACKQLPRSYKLWKMVRVFFFFLSLSLDLEYGPIIGISSLLT